MQRILSLLHQQSLTTALRAISAPVDRSHIDSRTFRRLCADLRATMRKEGGVGLAAPQCGERLRVFVMDMQQPVHRRLMRSSHSTTAYAQQHALIPLKDEPRLSEEHWDRRLRLEERKAEQMLDEEEKEERQEKDKQEHPRAPLVLINPVVVAVSPHSGIEQEMCLSIPGCEQHSTPFSGQQRRRHCPCRSSAPSLTAACPVCASLCVFSFVGGVSRPSCCDVRFVDEWNVERQMRLRGFDARVFQHETDHLNGVLYIDHITDPDDNLIYVTPAKIQAASRAHRQSAVITKL